MPSQNKTWVNASAIPRQANQVFMVIRWLVAYDSKPSTGRYRAGWLWGSWVQSQAELHIQTPLSSLESGMVTHNCNIGTGEAERKRRIAKSLWPVCHTQGTLGQPSYRVSACPTPNPSKFINTNLQAYTNSPPPTDINFCLLYCCKGNPGPCTELHWTPPPVFPSPHRPKDMKQPITHSCLSAREKFTGLILQQAGAYRLTRGVD